MSSASLCCSLCQIKNIVPLSGFDRRIFAINHFQEKHGFAPVQRFDLVLNSLTLKHNEILKWLRSILT